MLIQDRIAIVSGASSGLGAACVQRFLERGARVVGLDLAPPRDDVPWIGAEAYTHILTNVTEAESVQSAVNQAVERFGRLEIAVCCAGVLHGERVVGREGPGSLDAFRRVLDINVCGTYNVVRCTAAAMMRNTVSESEPERGVIERGVPERGVPERGVPERGVIVMTSSIAAYDGQIGQAAYAASKGAVASMTLPMAREFGQHGIRVVSVAPGVFETPMMQAASEKVRQPLLAQSIFPKRFGFPREFADFVEQILQNSMLNGSTVRLDGALRM
jgi:NAD(P)-dependent dehydrogenase (short-subunit alcohol dehydrogenase family)